MANEKISQLPSGSPAQSTDLVPIARSGSNFYLTIANIVAAFAGAIGFGSLTTGTNTQAAMTVGSGATLEPSGSGVIEANEVSGVTVSGTPSAGEVLTATSSSAADWQAPQTLALPGTGLRLQFGVATGTGSNQPVSFPVSFSSGSVYVVLGNTTGSAAIHTGSVTTSGFALDYSGTGQQVYWFAIGNA